MTEAKHTPGPWIADGSKWRGQITVRRAGDIPSPIADMWLNGDDPAANARLIAAAPDMMEALHKVERALVDGALVPLPGYSDEIVCLAVVRTAIAKAEGR